MVLDLRKLFSGDGSICIDAEFDFSDIEFSGVFPIMTPVKITGEILSKTGIVSLSAEIAVEYTADCDRCGTRATNKYSFELQKVIVTELANGTENDDMLVLPDMQLNLLELAREEVVLCIPSKHLCREDCKGVCQKCGKNLNEGSCTCNTKEIDPRLEILQQLLNDE